MHMRRPATPRVEPIPEVAAKAQARMAQSPANAINVLATMAHNKVISKAIGKFAGAVLTETTIPARQRELAILRMGWNCQAVYEFGQHTLFGRAAGLTDEEIHRTTLPVDAPGWTDDERTLVQMVDDLTEEDCVSDATPKAGLIRIVPELGRASVPVYEWAPSRCSPGLRERARLAAELVES